ncbi:malonyl-ACP O-methyltransferase BioC [Pontibacter sp. JAM-7]|uniref:malonyl-ACP O-methyltransferase BioC n=1 Tax=Pontibacter sp. JAM-7 TaxID=3366581 RepID=UPI003AF91F32
MAESNRLKKQRVAESFSRAAGSYDRVADLQRQVGQMLVSYLPSIQAERVLDLGCGTGFFGPILRQCYPQAQLLNLDLAQGMLHYARQHRPVSNAHWLCGDAEALPLADSSVDLIFSSLAIQWCEQPDLLFSEVQRVLKPGGCFVAATLGPDTLLELRRAWEAVDDFVHVNRFIPLTDLLVTVPEGLQCVVQQEEQRVLEYAQLKQLTDELKELGAHNMNQGQATGLTGRRQLRQFRNAYEAQRRSDEMLPATYQIYYLVFQQAK